MTIKVLDVAPLKHGLAKLRKHVNSNNDSDRPGVLDISEELEMVIDDLEKQIAILENVSAIERQNSVAAAIDELKKHDVNKALVVASTTFNEHFFTELNDKEFRLEMAESLHLYFTKELGKTSDVWEKELEAA